MEQPKEKNSIKIPDKCLRCGQSYQKKDAHILCEKENVIIFHLTCSNCETSIILNVAVSKEGVLSMGTMTDAGKEDIEKLRCLKPISIDDVIQTYVYFKNSKIL